MRRPNSSLSGTFDSSIVPILNSICFFIRILDKSLDKKEWNRKQIIFETQFCWSIFRRALWMWCLNADWWRNFSDSSPLCECEHKRKALKWAPKLCKWNRMNPPSATHTKGSSDDLQRHEKWGSFSRRLFGGSAWEKCESILRNCLCGSDEAELRVI